MENLREIRNKYRKLTEGVIDYDKFNHYGIVHHGSSIEGSTLSLEETYLLLDENLTPKNKPLPHTLMTVDHFKALQFVLVLAGKKGKLSLEIVQKISSLIKQLIADINAQIDQVEKFEDIYKLAFDAHYQMVSIHPFADGNGRLSRLLMNYVQHYHREPLTIVFKEDKIDYYQALEETRDKEDIGVFEAFMFNQAYKFFVSEIDNLTKKQIDKSNPKGFSFLF